MHNHYIINGIVEFHPATSTLRDLNNPDHVVIFNSPAGRCLLLLIERVGTIVTKSEFFDVVWTKRGMQVSSNTFYQNISILRKGLKKIGLSEDLVVTIPRIGLTLASDTHIRKLTTDQQVENCSENAHFIDEQALVSEPKPAQQQQYAPEEMQGKKAPQLSKSMRAKLKRINHYLYIKLIVVLMSIVVISASVMILRGSGDNNHYFSHYQPFKTIQGCHILLSEGIVSDEDYTKALSRGQQFADRCNNYPWVYISFLPLLPRTSVIRCDKPMSEPNACISDYFFEDK